MNIAMPFTTPQIPTPLIPGMAVEPGVEPETPLGRLLGISSKLMDGLWFCPAIPTELCGELVKTGSGHNRKINYENVRLMATIMRAGTWSKRVGMDIHFHRDGWLANGQHRLQAAVKSGQTFYGLIHTGLNDREVGALDQGRKRSASDILAMSFGSRELGTERTAATNAVLQYMRGELGFNTKGDPHSVAETAVNLTREENDIIKKAKKITRELGGLSSVMAGICIVWHRKRPKECAEFLNDAESGLTADPTNPAYLFRKCLIAAKGASNRNVVGGKRWLRGGFGQILIRAANLKSEGKAVSVLVVGGKDTPKVDLVCAPVLGAARNKPLLDS